MLNPNDPRFTFLGQGGKGNWSPQQLGPVPQKVNQPAPFNVAGLNIPGLDLSQYKEYGGGKNSIGDPMNMAKLLSTGFFPLVLQQLQNAQKLQPQKDKALQAGMKAMDPANRQALIDRFRKQAMAQAQSSSAQQAASMRGSGYSDALTGGMTLDASNRAETAAGDYAAKLYSPEFDMQSAMSMMQLLDSGSQIPALQQLLGLISAGTSPPQPDKPTFLESLLGIGASILPAGIGAGWFK